MSVGELRFWHIPDLGVASAGGEGHRQAMVRAGLTRDLSARNGIECLTVTGAGTFEFESASGVYTELQCGAYIFMDADYGGISIATTPRPRPSNRASSSGRR